MSLTKLCSCCKTEFLTTQFNKDRHKSDGLRIYCKKCDRLKSNSYYNNLHPNKRISKKKYIGNYDERQRQAVKTYRETEKYKLNRKKYKEKKYVKKLIYESVQKWRKNNPDKIKKYDSQKNSRRRKYLFIELFDNFYPSEIEIDYHHINDILVIPIPRKTHLSFSCNNKEKHRELCNKWIDNLFNVSNITGE